MSPSAPSFISIGCDAGGPETRAVADLKIPLYRALLKHVTSSHCEAVDQYALVLRIDGTIAKFGEEGVTRLRFAKARRYITVDIQIPEAVWQPMTEQMFKAYLAAQVTKAVSTCVDRLRREKCAVSSSELMAQVEAGTSEYLSATNDG